MTDYPEESPSKDFISVLFDKTYKFIVKKRSLNNGFCYYWQFHPFCCISVMFTSFLESVRILPTSTPTAIPERSIPTIEIPLRTPTRMATLTETPAPTKTAILSPVPHSATLAIPTKTTGAPCNCTGPDLNCSNFYSQIAAQECFNFCLGTGFGDVFDLDSDKDLQVCESLP